MRKTLAVAVREYRAAVRTKSFIITLLLMPLLMGGSAAVQVFFKRQSDVKDKHFAVIDRTPGTKLFPVIKARVDERNQAQSKVRETKEPSGPLFILDAIPPSEDTPDAVNNQRLELSKQVRDDKYWGFVDIGPDACEKSQAVLTQKDDAPIDPRAYLRYQTNHPTYEAFPSWLEKELLTAIIQISQGVKVDPEIRPRGLQREGLTERDPVTGKIGDPPIIHQVARFIIPAALVALMFMIVMLSSTPAMQGIVEEKMQRIAEVLLGSLPPFQLMAGKLLGLMGVSLTVAAVYLGGAYWAAYRYGFADLLPIPTLAWFVLFQVVAVLMYGSLFLAIGAAATDMKETQSLVMPVMLIACIPMFILSTALEDPNNPVVVATSFFPPSTPMLMMARLAIPPGPPAWQALCAVALVLIFTTLCVYAAGRIFRVGILMQGKGAKLGQLLQWIFRG